jgi:hypothetical protein
MGLTEAAVAKLLSRLKADALTLLTVLTDAEKVPRLKAELSEEALERLTHILTQADDTSLKANLVAWDREFGDDPEMSNRFHRWQQAYLKDPIARELRVLLSSIEQLHLYLDVEVEDGLQRF